MIELAIQYTTVLEAIHLIASDFYKPFARSQQFESIWQSGNKDFFKSRLRGIATSQPNHLWRWTIAFN